VRIWVPSVAIVLLTSLAGCGLGGPDASIVGQWREMEGNQLDFTSGPGAAVLECFPDGTAVLREGSRTSNLLWRRRDGGSISLLRVTREEVSTIGLVDVLGDALVVTNQSGTGRFLRIEAP
jgi:hypothetical protein